MRTRSVRAVPSSLAAAVVAAAIIAAAFVTSPAAAAEESDPYLWLEEIDGARAVAWVKEQSARTTAELERTGEFKPILDRVLGILDSKDRVPTPRLVGDAVYNFWQDEKNPRGLWRRTTLASYRTESPTWETLLDIDALDAKEGVNWVFKGSECLEPEHRHCIVQLARGGSDASVHREFDTMSKSFVEGGFTLPEAKSFIAWRDADTVWVGTDFGPGSMTDAGYARIVKLWKRGTPLSEARTIYETKPSDVFAFGSSAHTPEGRYDFVVRVPAFFRQEVFLVLGDRLVKIDLPEDVNPEGHFKGRMLVSLRSEYTAGGRTYPQGALLAIDLDAFLRGSRDFEILFTPTERVFLRGVAQTRSRLLLTTLDNVTGRLVALEPSTGTWNRSDIQLPGLGAVGVLSASAWSDDYVYSYNDMLTPSALFLVRDGRAEKVKQSPAFFSAEGVKVEQHEAVSKDGTRIPYFVATPKGFKADGTAPTHLTGYGGFEAPSLPTYGATVGAAWIERGGVYVIANIRGGGEFGPRWHQAAQRENRIKSFEDFIAVAEDLIARKITSPRHLGIEGGSQGGLLVGGAYTMRPDLFGAVVCAVPLADMRRYSKLLAGASWMAEYGDPDDPRQWEFIRTWSPYALLKKDVVYPKVFFWTNTRDDRVHPGHARKMAAKMMDLGHPVYYFENLEGGHGAGSINRQKAYTTALEYAYLWRMLK